MAGKIEELRMCLEQSVPGGYAYLASPYSKYDGGMHRAFTLACAAAGRLIVQGVPVFCPIAQSHSICENVTDLPAEDHDLWLRADKPLLAGASALVVLAIRGWDESVGVKWELDYRLGLSGEEGVFFMTPCGEVWRYREYLEATGRP